MIITFLTIAYLFVSLLTIACVLLQPAKNSLFSDQTQATTEGSSQHTGIRRLTFLLGLSFFALTLAIGYLQGRNDDKYDQVLSGEQVIEEEISKDMVAPSSAIDIGSGTVGSEVLAPPEG